MADRKDNVPSNAKGRDQETHFIDNRYAETDGKDSINSKPRLSTTVMKRGDGMADIVMPI
jgi:hypothetical protein